MQRIAHTVRASAVAGTALALLDAATTPVRYATWSERVALWGSIFGLLISSSVAVGLVLGAGLQVLAPRLDRFWPRWGSAQTHARLRSLLLAATAIALFLLDARLLRRLYPTLHALLLAGSFSALALAASAFRAPSSRRALRDLVPLVALAPLSLLLQTHSQNVRFLLHQQTTAARQLVGLFARTPLPVVASAPQPKQRDAPLPPVAPDAHLVLITVDALRPDHTGPWGYRRTVNGQPLTPTLDALAQRAVRIDRTYAQAPHSAYSISSLLTADYIAEEVQLGAPLPPTLADHLAARGFHTEAFFPLGLFFNGRKELAAYAERRFGFESATTWDLDARALTDHVLARLDELHRQGEPRTLLWVHYFDVHEPYVRHPEFDLGDAPADRYDSEIAFFDHELQRLLDGLARLDRPTVIALTADHGEELGDHGGWYHGSSLYEEQVRVPLLVVAPGLSPKTVAGPAELVDLAPTLLSIVGEPIPHSMRGNDLLPELLDGKSALNRPVFSQVEHKRMVVQGTWKLVHDFRRDTWELYNLAADARELSNVFDRNPSMGNQLGDELHRFLASFGSPPNGTSDAVPEPLVLARLGDKRTAAALADLAIDRARPAALRAEAARRVGMLEGYAGRDGLRTLLWPDASCDAVCAEAALALGELTDKRAIPTLVHLLDDARYRRRAAVMLGRLRDVRAAPALIEALEDADLRRQAAHYLGFVGDERAIAPLAAHLGDKRAGDVIPVALARVGARTERNAGERSVLPQLLARLHVETREDDRSYLFCALGLLGDRRPEALAAALRGASSDPPTKWASETLVRLGAIAAGVVDGVDAAPESAHALRGVQHCQRRQSESTDDYSNATTCALPGPGVVTIFRRRDGIATLLVRLRAEAAGTLHLSLNGHAFDRPLLPGWQELRVPLLAWRAGENALGIRVDSDGKSVPSELDHLLVLPPN